MISQGPLLCLRKLSLFFMTIVIALSIAAYLALCHSKIFLANPISLRLRQNVSAIRSVGTITHSKPSLIKGETERDPIKGIRPAETSSASPQFSIKGYLPYQISHDVRAECWLESRAPHDQSQNANCADPA